MGVDGVKKDRTAKECFSFFFSFSRLCVFCCCCFFSFFTAGGGGGDGDGDGRGLECRRARKSLFVRRPFFFFSLVLERCVNKQGQSRSLQGDCEERALLRETGQRVRVCSEQGEDEDEEEEEVEEEVEEAAAAAEEKHQHRDSLRALWALLWLSLAAAAAAAASASSSVPSPASLGGSTVSPLASGTLGTCCCPRDGVSPALFRSLALTRLSLLPLRLPLHSQPVFSSPSPSSSFLLVASKSHFIYFIFSLDPNWLVVPLPYYAYRTGPTLWTRRYHGPPAAFISA